MSNLMIGKVNLGNDTLFVGKGRKIRASSMIINTAAPKHFMYELSSRGSNFDSVAYLLEEESVLKEVKDIIADVGFWELAVSKITGAKSGMITPDADNLPFSLVHKRVNETLAEEKYAHSQSSAMVVSMLAVDLMNVLGLMGSPSSLKIFDTKEDMFVSKAALVRELYKDRIKFALDKLSFLSVEKKKKVSIAGVIDAFESNLQDFTLALDSLKQIPKQIDTLISLVKAYICNDYSNLDDKELYFFELPEFLEVAHNYSFIQMAIKSKNTKPLGNSNYWSLCVSAVMSGLKSSNMLSVVEMSALKEYFTITTVEDVKGFRRGVIASKNMAEAQPLQIMRVVSKTDLAAKITEDKTAQSAFAMSHALASKLTSSKIHTHIHTMLTSIVTDKMDMFVCNIGLDQEDLDYIAAVYADSLELNMNEYDEAKELSIVYVINTEDSQIMDGLSTVMGIAKTMLPDAVLLYASEMAGSKLISYKEQLITDTKNVGFTNIREAFTDDLGIGVESVYSYGGERLKLDLYIDELAGLVNLDDTYAIKPLIGASLFDSLFAAHKMILKFTSDSKNNEFGTVANIALIRLLKEVIDSSDVDNILGAALSQLWATRKASGKGEAKFSHSLLAQEHVKAELRVRLALLILTKLGFIDDDMAVEVVSNFRKAGAFDLYKI